MEGQVASVREGDIIADKYRVERVLGMGGMGVVVAATNLKLDQQVALKFLLPTATKRPEVVARFAREARAAAKIKCDHVARVLDVDTLPDGSPYMVMEFMHGEDLERLLLTRGPLPIDVAVDYVLQACEALAEAHALGIVHRDLKPANLFLANRPNGEPIIKVLDFGISKSTLSISEGQLTKTSAILGSPLYMSPEQMTSAKYVDLRSDLWAMGVVLYELLGGRTPFPADTMPELIAAILQRAPDPIRSIREEVPEELAAAIARCLEKDPAQRFSNVAEMAAAFAPFGPAKSDASVDRISHVLGVGAVVRRASNPAPSIRAGGSQPATATRTPTASPWSQSLNARPLALVAGALAMFVLGVGGTVLVVRNSSNIAPSAATTAAATTDFRSPPKSTESSSAAPAAPAASEAARAPAPTGTTPDRAAATGAPTPRLVATGAQHSSAAAAPVGPSVAATPIKPATPPTTGVDCSSPFTIDARGHRVPKPECL